LRACQLRQLIPTQNPRPFPLPSLCPDGLPAINGKPPATPSPTRLSSHPQAFISLRTHPCASLCLCNTPTRATEPQFRHAAASVFRRRHRFIAAGEGLDLPPVSFDL
jgi:hypothetical protein